jgi:hypothetical protein
MIGRLSTYHSRWMLPVRRQSGRPRRSRRCGGVCQRVSGDRGDERRGDGVGAYSGAAGIAHAAPAGRARATARETPPAPHCPGRESDLSLREQVRERTAPARCVRPRAVRNLRLGLAGQRDLRCCRYYEFFNANDLYGAVPLLWSGADRDICLPGVHCCDHVSLADR